MENLRGSLFMVLAMAGFAVEDALIKTVADELPIGQILCLIGIGGALIYGSISLARRENFLSLDILQPAVALRNLGEVIGAVGFVTAFVLTPLSSASAIIQATSLAVTMGAAIFMGEQVGLRRWGAIFVGFAGVLLVIRPGFEGFQPASLFAVLAVFGLALRDLATRAAPAAVSTFQLGGYAFISLVLAGLILLAITGGAVQPSARAWGYLIVALLFGLIAYYGIVTAMRMGDASFVTSFRYTRLIFALIIGYAVFHERPDALTYAGALLIIGSGLFSVVRERQLARRMARQTAR